MSDALAGWYTDVVYLKKAGIARISVEINLDLWEQHQAVLGIPPSFDGAKKYVALTRITEDAFKKWAGASAPEGNGPDSGTFPAVTPMPSAVVAAPASVANSQDKPRTPFREMPRSAQAGMKIQDYEFAKWLCGDAMRSGPPLTGSDIDAVDAILKAKLNIISKKDLDRWEEAGANWDKMFASFETRAYAR